MIVALVGAGFSLEEIREMTLAQVSAYLAALQRRERHSAVMAATGQRAAMADKGSWNDWTKEMLNLPAPGG